MSDSAGVRMSATVARRRSGMYIIGSSVVGERKHS